MTEALDRAREAFRATQGAGARYDDPAAPGRELAWARLGTAFFSRVLQSVPDGALDAPSLLPGWDRRTVVAHVGYNARALSRLVEGARIGVPGVMYPSPEYRLAEITLGASLPPRALRHLHEHALTHLDVEWRDLRGAAWDAAVVTGQGRSVPVRETAWMRAREVWLHAVDLDAGASFRQFPEPLLLALAEDVRFVWERTGRTPDLSVRLRDRDATLDFGPENASRVRAEGTLADTVAWLTGRGRAGITGAGSWQPPAWL